MKFPIRNRSRLLASLAAAALLAACGGGVDSDDDHEHEDISIDTAGRLAVTELNTTTLRMHDLDSGSIEAGHAMTDVPSAVYASPGGGYAVAALAWLGITR